MYKSYQVTVMNNNFAIGVFKTFDTIEGIVKLHFTSESTTTNTITDNSNNQTLIYNASCPLYLLVKEIEED